MSKMLVTAGMLRVYGACAEEAEVFECEWPKGASVTIKNVMRAFTLGLSVFWFTHACLASAARDPFWWAEQQLYQALCRGELTKRQYRTQVARLLVDTLKQHGFEQLE